MTQVALGGELGSPPLRQMGKARGHDNRRGLVLLTLPAVVWYLIFTIGPLVAMFVISGFEWRSLASKPVFNNFENYGGMVTAPTFWPAIANTAVHLVATIPFMMVVSFMMGYYLNLKPRGHRVLRILMFAPALISISALGTMFVAILGPRGLVNGALTSVGLSGLTASWLADSRFALLAIILVTIWSGLGFNAILFAARLSAVSGEVYEAAEIDGASHWRRMWSVAFPITIDYFGVLTMLQYLWNLFGTAGLILLLTNGGPGTSTTTLSWLVFQNAFLQNRIGYSQAVGVLLFVLGVVGLLLIRRAFRQRY